MVEEIYDISSETSLLFSSPHGCEVVCHGLFPGHSVSKSEDVFRPPPPQLTRFSTMEWRYPLYASAEPINVKKIMIYRPQPQSHGAGVIGMVIHYLEGAQRALGICRLGVDEVEECSSLHDVYFNTDSEQLLVTVSIGTPEDLSDWVQLREGCTLEAWYTADSVSMHLRETESGAIVEN